MLADNRETSLPIFVFRMTYFSPSWKRPSPCFQYVPTTVVVLIRQPSQNIHTFCQRFRSPYVFWSISSLRVDETAEVVLPSATSTEFDSVSLHTIYRYSPLRRPRRAHARRSPPQHRHARRNGRGEEKTGPACETPRTPCRGILHCLRNRPQVLDEGRPRWT